MPYQPQATTARISAGSRAPRVPNEVRASTAYGMPYLVPAWPISSIGSSTITLAKNTVNTACHADMPPSTRLAASI
jgi:hypothetical protein